MKSIIDDFNFRVRYLSNLNYNEAETRLSDFYNWLINTKPIKNIVDKIISNAQILEGDELIKTPSNPQEITAFGIFLLSEISQGNKIYNIGRKYDIRPSFNTNSLQDMSNEVIDRYITPAIEYLEHELNSSDVNADPNSFLQRIDEIPSYPLEIHESLQKFFNDYPDINRNAFIMMRFRETKTHSRILKSIKTVLNKYGINALRADEKEYHDDLFPNVLTYIHGCKFGIAVFERLEQEEFNPNVSLEVGYLRALKRSICLLKDKTLKTLQTDLIGKLYKSFDPQEPEETIEKELEKWLRDKEII